MSDTKYKYHKLRGRVGVKGEEYIYIQQPYVEWEFVSIPDSSTKIYISRTGENFITKERDYFYTLDKVYPESLLNATLFLCKPEWLNIANKAIAKLIITYDEKNTKGTAKLLLKSIEGEVEGCKINWNYENPIEITSDGIVIENEITIKPTSANINSLKIKIISIALNRTFCIKSLIKELSYCSHVVVNISDFIQKHLSFLCIERSLFYINRSIHEEFTSKIDGSYKRIPILNTYTTFLSTHKWYCAGNYSDSFTVNIDTTTNREQFSVYSIYLESSSYMNFST